MTLPPPFAVLLLLGLLCVPVVMANTDPTDNAPTSLLQPLVVSQLDWVLSFLNNNNNHTSTTVLLDEAAYEERFAAPFRAQVPLDLFLQFSTEYQNKSWSVHSATPYLNGGVMILQSQLDLTEGIVLYLDVVPDVIEGTSNTTETDTATDSSLLNEESGKIASLVVNPYEPPTPPPNAPQSIEEAAEQLHQLASSTAGGNFHYIVADIGDSNTAAVCQTLYGTNETQPMPIGSMFKFYVLAAVLDALEDGRISSWTQPVVIEPQYFSLPSGIVQGDKPGSSRTVRELATLMIVISDNTATDHLMGLVGRAAVEQAMVDYNHHNPPATISQPFLFTRDFFLLKLLGKTTLDGVPGTIGSDYQQATSVEERRQILEDELGNVTIDALDLAQVIPLWSFPVAVDAIEWFASPMDLCHVLNRLQQDTVAREILAMNNGVLDPLGFDLEQADLYSNIGFKGGSEPGMLGLAWYVESWPENNDSSATGRVVAGAFWNTDRALTDEESIQMPLLMDIIRDMAVSDEYGADNINSSDSDADIDQGTIEPLTSAPSMAGEESVDPSSGASTTKTMLSFMALLGTLFV